MVGVFASGLGLGDTVVGLVGVLIGLSRWCINRSVIS